MNKDNTQRQITQMCRFIHQEAKEKVNEIMLKTEQERDKTLSLLDVQGRAKIDEEFERKKKGLNKQKRIMKAKAAQKEEARYSRERNGMILEMLEDSKKELMNLSKVDKAAYKKLLVQLMTQGLLKLQEKNVKVKCRKQDLKMVQSVQATAVKEYQAYMKKSCDVTPSCTIEVDPERFIDAKGPGGIWLSCHGGKIILDNTLQTRLNTAFYDLKPVIRAVVFPSLWKPPPDFMALAQAEADKAAAAAAATKE